MSDTVKLGQLIDGEAHRDAIHIAIAPVVAGTDLEPGTEIGFLGDGTVGSVQEHRIGIVDPFLKRTVIKGQKFYMCLFPGTITSLRHQWTHPAFVTSVVTATRDESTPEEFKIAADYLEDGGFVAPAKALRDARPARTDSESWLRVYASRMNSYQDPDSAFSSLIEGLRSGELFANGSDLHSFHDVDDADDLRRHAEAYLGIPINWDDFTFSCSC